MVLKGAWLTAALLALAPLAPAAAAGTIHGRVAVSRETAVDDSRPALAALGKAAPRDPGDPSRSVVYLESAPQPALAPPAPMRAALDQRNESFVPHVVAVTVGSTVDFPNSDRTYHNVFSLSKPRKFDLGRYPRGQSRSVRFDQPGVVRVFCEIHSHMNAWILVFAHRYFAATDAEGRYRIEGVPPGAYTLVAWNEGAVRARREVRVDAEASVANVDFDLP